MASKKGGDGGGGLDLEAIAEKRRQVQESDSALSASSEGSWSGSESDSEDEAEGGSGTRGGLSRKERAARRPPKTFYQKIRKAMRDVSNAISKSFVDYGPPYYEDPDRESLIEAVCYMEVSLIKVHGLLNARADPNEPDPEDNYFTPMHYCARHGHLLVMRMLRRAGAQVNPINEFGQSPLAMCCMAKPMHDKELTQIKMFKWLIEQGADVNSRDKGGYEPLDYCVMNNNIEMIQILLNEGVRLRRDNLELVAKRRSLLKLVYDPDIYRILNSRLQEEEEVFQAREAEKKAIQDEIDADNRAVKNLEMLAKRKKIREQRLKDDAILEAQLAKEAQRKANIEASLLQLTKGKKTQQLMYGTWEKDEQRNWSWKARQTQLTLQEQANKTHASACSQMFALQNKNKKEMYEKRWQEMGGEGKIVVPWTRSKAFDTEEKMGEEESVVSVEINEDEDLNFRDEDDEELDGEDFDDLFGAQPTLQPSKSSTASNNGGGKK